MQQAPKHPPNREEVTLTKQDITDLKELITCMYQFTYKGDWRICLNYIDDKDTEEKTAKLIDKLTLLEMLVSVEK